MCYICYMLKKIAKIIMISVVAIVIFICLVFAFLYFWPSIGRLPDKNMQKEYAARTPYFYDGTFHNQNDVSLLSPEKEEKSDRLKPKGTIPVIKSENVPAGENGKLYVTWLGHSSILVQMGEKNILIDPVFSKYSSPVGFAGVKRFSQVPIEFEDFPDIDILLISHDHYDHLDYKTIKRLDDKVNTYVVPLGLESYLMGWGIDQSRIKTMSWYDEYDKDGLKITATPSKHYTGRNPLKQNASWWCGFHLDDGYHTVYYSGDGGYCENFKEINEKLGDVDLALMECGQYGKGWPNIHMFPEETVKAVSDIGADWFIPVHWGAYCICYNDWDDSVIRSLKESERLSINEATPKIGERVDFDDIEKYNEHWWEDVDK